MAAHQNGKLNKSANISTTRPTTSPEEAFTTMQPGTARLERSYLLYSTEHPTPLNKPMKLFGAGRISNTSKPSGSVNNRCSETATIRIHKLLLLTDAIVKSGHCPSWTTCRGAADGAGAHRDAEIPSR